MAPGTGITVTFSEPVTATAASFTIACASTPQPFTVGGSGTDTITLNPNTALPAATSCTVTALAAAISDVDTDDPPDHPASDFSFSFTTGSGAPGDTAPTDIALSAATVAENQPAGTPVGTLSTTDPDAGDTFTYSLVPGTGSADNGSFKIVGDALQTNASLDFEATPTLTIRVRSTDSGGLFVEKAFTITVTNVNEAPTNIALSNASIDENQPSGTPIGTLTATDPDAAQTHTFSLQAAGCGGGPFPDNSSFTIAGGVLQSAASFDFEVKASYTICVRATDSGTPALSFDKQLTITIIDVNDPPTVTPDSYTGAIGNTLAVGRRQPERPARRARRQRPARERHGRGRRSDLGRARGRDVDRRRDGDDQQHGRLHLPARARRQEPGRHLHLPRDGRHRDFRGHRHRPHRRLPRLVREQQRCRR